MGLIILRLHGHAPYGNITVSLLCVVLRGRQDPGTACGLPLWAFHGQLEWCTDEKWRSLQAPLFLSDFALGNHIYESFLSQDTKKGLFFLVTSNNFYANLAKMYLYSFRIQSKPVHSRWDFLFRHCDCVELRSSNLFIRVCCFFWSDIPQGRFEIKHLHSSLTILQLSVPYCINPGHLQRVSPCF